MVKPWNEDRAEVALSRLRRPLHVQATDDGAEEHLSAILDDAWDAVARVRQLEAELAEERRVHHGGEVQDTHAAVGLQWVRLASGMEGIVTRDELAVRVAWLVEEVVRLRAYLSDLGEPEPTEETHRGLFGASLRGRYRDHRP